MKKILYILMIILSLPTLISSRPHGLKNFSATCYINSIIQAFNALDPVTAYLLTLEPNPYKQTIGERPPEAGLGYYYVEFLKKLYALPPTPPLTINAADSLDYLGFVHEFKRNILETAEDEGVYINIQNTKVREFPFKKQDKDYIQKLANFYNTALAEFIYRAIYRSVDPLPSDVTSLLNACPQADVPEFIERLINALIEQDTRYTYRNTEHALQSHPLGKLFRIEVKKTKECTGYEGTITEQESRLNLQTISGEDKTFTTLQACINNILSAEMIEYTPPGFIEKQHCIQKSQLTHLSEIIILAFNRFKWAPSGGIKYKHKIAIPINYDFATHVPKEYKEQTNYELVAAIEHIGGYGSGHYIVYVKQNSQWYICNDEHVFAVNALDIADYSNKWGAGRKEHRGLDYAYVYFYQKGKKVPEKKAAHEKQLQETLQKLRRQLTVLEKILRG